MSRVFDHWAGKEDGHPPKLCLFGAPGSNSNLGLNALMQGTLASVAVHAPAARFTVFDNKLGVRTPTGPETFGLPAYRFIGARLSRRITRPESFSAMSVALTVRGRGNPGARAVATADAVLDVSGGDSFSDLYGDRRFQTVCAPKRLALRAGRPLILLPQTYGPFTSKRSAETARTLLRHCEQAWARDADSHALLVDLLGPDYDPDRHRLGVDLAMLLPSSPQVDLPEPVEHALATEPAPVAVNVSGLLWNDQEPFGLTSDYRAAMGLIVRGLVGAGHHVVLVPHVLGRRPAGEADNLAADELVAGLPSSVAGRVSNVPWLQHAGEAKNVISRCAFLVGTRMHATIAALSGGVPCAAIAYSPKYRGIFTSMGMGDAVLDARTLSTDAIVDAALHLVEQRDVARKSLAGALPGVQQVARDQMRRILSAANGRVSSAP